MVEQVIEIKKKRHIILIVSILLAICFASCSFTDEQISDKANTGAVNSNDIEGTEQEYHFLLLASEATSDTLRSKFENAQHYGLYSVASQEVMKELEKHTHKGLRSGSKELKYAYSECFYKSSESKELGSYYSVYDIYRSNGEELGVLHGTDLICFYFNSQNDSTETVTITESKALMISDDFVISVVGQEIFAEFDCVSANEDKSGLFSYIIHYSRTTNGYKTDENISVYIDKTGTVIGYNGYNVCKYDAMKELFVEEKIEQAKNELIDKINSLELKNVKMNECIITTNADGELYLKLNFVYEDEYGSQCGETVFVNLY